MPDVVTLNISVRPSTLLVLKRARRFYESVANEELLIYAPGPTYKFYDADRAVMRDTAAELRYLITELESKLAAAGVVT
jgi:hypothetical protein